MFEHGYFFLNFGQIGHRPCSKSRKSSLLARHAIFPAGKYFDCATRNAQHRIVLHAVLFVTLVCTSSVVCGGTMIDNAHYAVWQ